MSNQRSHHAVYRVAAILLTATALSACGADGSTDGSAESPATGASSAATSGSFCDQLDGIEETYQLVTAMEDLEPTDLGPSVDAAASLFDSAEPPAAIAEDWDETGRFVRLLDDALAGRDTTDEQDMQEVGEESGEQIMKALLSAQPSAQKVGNYVQTECGVDLGVSETAAVSDACTLLDDGDVADAFDGSAPTPESRPYGAGTAECIWADQEHEVSIAIMPAATLRKEYVSKSTPLDVAVPGVPGGHAYMGVFGVGRFSTDGHTVSFVAGKQGGLVSVKLGPDGDQRAEIDLASELAGTLVEGLQS